MKITDQQIDLAALELRGTPSQNARRLALVAKLLTLESLDEESEFTIDSPCAEMHLVIVMSIDHARRGWIAENEKVCASHQKSTWEGAGCCQPHNPCEEHRL